jgi:hypothetical protein
VTSFPRSMDTSSLHKFHGRRGPREGEQRKGLKIPLCLSGRGRSQSLRQMRAQENIDPGTKKRTEGPGEEST